MEKSLNIDTMDGYDFERFIVELLVKMELEVEHTALSGDGGIDIIAFSKDLFFKGKYIIQCKRYSGNIGEPPIRDLYGVVLSERANKGILITNSFFTEKAKDFAEGKNIELIDGDILSQLIIKHFGNDNIDKKEANIFYKKEGFDNQKYQYYRNLISNDKRNINNYEKLFQFLFSYIESKNMMIIYSGLLEECEKLSNEIILRANTKGKIGESIKHKYIHLTAYLNILKGQIAKAYELLKNNDILYSKVAIGKKSAVREFIINTCNSKAIDDILHYFNEIATDILQNSTPDINVTISIPEVNIPKFTQIFTQQELIFWLDFSSEKSFGLEDIVKYWPKNTDIKFQIEKIKFLESV